METARALFYAGRESANYPPTQNAVHPREVRQIVKNVAPQRLAIWIPESAVFHWASFQIATSEPFPRTIPTIFNFATGDDFVVFAPDWEP